MKKTLSHFLLLFVVVLLMAGCKKDEPEYTVAPKSSIIFDDNIDKVTADYKKAGNLVLKVGINGPATSVRITSSYSVGSTPKTKDLNSFPVVDGAATVNIPAVSVRNTADGELVGATSNATTRPPNTYVLIVDAVNPDGSTDRRYFTTVIVQ
ncbi:hypothetical protein SAMN02745146_2363 [Hymenobacter daecheongensis DSM 21074]|uniref:DUF4625 domain-containing protein n=1 Tax=Hymenobacter daecheongensis DSM 21074 TaxID=1121955 RepID=A0A1M6GRN5_9BACT|nr:hypothetical protein [Hymenobacter daecheongensis]SHJ12613.1 hypothetical protein SAMN02745146_2363 [Hymenobacter daecheongensis DSM 21074]